MTSNVDLEGRLRRHLAAEADDLPFVLDAEAVRQRLAQRSRRRSRLVFVPAAAAVVLAVVIGQALIGGLGRNAPGGPANWGPLAVVPSTGGDEALNSGFLRITERCVVLETAGGELELLVWPADRARWEATDGTIGFANSDGSDHRLRDDEPVSFGGGGDSTAEGGVSGTEWAASVDWVAAPEPSCPMAIRWFVNEVVSPADDAPAPSGSPVGFTKGPIPPSARLADGSIDVSRVPDFIPATNGDGTAGWIASRDVPAEGEHMPEVITVFADDLQTVVGHMYPGVGFVPLGREEEMLSPPGQDRDLTITIRNDWDRPAILEVIEPPDEVEGRPPARIAPSIVLDVGEEGEVRIRAPSNRWSLRFANGDRGFLYSDDLGRRTRELESGTFSAVYVAISSNGSMSLITEP